MKSSRVFALLIFILASLTTPRCGGRRQDRPRESLQPITYQDFLEAEKKDPYFKTRWRYFSIVIDLIHQMKPESALEVGAYSLPLIKGEDTMDIEKHLDNLTYLHDATVVPWPIPDKKYDLFLSCEVWEHLGDGQTAAFKEAMRVSRRAIFTFPYKWFFPKDSKDPWAPSHRDIDETRIAEWTLHQEPAAVFFSEDKKFAIHVFEFGDKKWAPAFRSDFSAWKGPDTIPAADLSKAIPPLTFVGGRGEFQVTRVPDPGGPILRLIPVKPDPVEGYVLFLGYFKDRNGFSPSLIPGQDVIFEAEVNLSAAGSGRHRLIIQDRTDQWEANTTVMDRPGWQRYLGRKTIREKSKDVIFGLSWRPSNEQESLEIRRLSLDVLPPPPPER